MSVAEGFIYAMCVAMAGVCVYLYFKLKNN
jgi:hypothetical protein